MNVRFRIGILVLAAAALPVAGVALVRAEDAQRGVSKEFQPLVTFTGPHSRINKPTWLRITSAKDFHPLFMRHVGLKPEEFDKRRNPHGVPTIDFERCMVVAVFRGDSWNSDGLYVKEVVEDGPRLIVRYDDRSYQTAGPDGGGVRVTPYGLFVMPRSDKELMVEENVQVYKRDSPKWEQRAHFPAMR
jgi:hypothetical protein